MPSAFFYLTLCRWIAYIYSTVWAEGGDCGPAWSGWWGRGAWSSRRSSPPPWWPVSLLTPSSRSQTATWPPQRIWPHCLCGWLSSESVGNVYLYWGDRWGMRHSSMALYFYRASKTCLHKPLANCSVGLFWAEYVSNICLQLLHFEYLSKINQTFSNDIFTPK